MSQNAIEICRSKYNHTPITVYDKGYYREIMNQEDILCDECVGHWIHNQAKALAFIVNRFLFASAAAFPMSLNTTNDSIDFSIIVPMLDYMNPIIGTGFKVSTRFYMINDHHEPKTPNGKFDSKLFMDITIELLTGREDENYQFTFNIRYNDPRIECSQWIRYLTDRIAGYLDVFIRGHYDSISAEEKEQIATSMQDFPTYHSGTATPFGDENCPCEDEDEDEEDDGSATNEVVTCSVCNIGTTKPYYIWNNRCYCIDCLYNYVVKSAINTHMADPTGIAINRHDHSEPKHNYKEELEWKIACIDRYFNALKDLGWNYEPPTIFKR